MAEVNSRKVDTKRLDSIIEACGGDKSHLIAILQKVQEEYKYLPENALIYIGTKIEGLSPATVYGVATFSSQFSLDPNGKFDVKDCDGTACNVRGSMPVLNAIKAHLKLEDGKMTTSDGLFSVETVSCLGACGLAPVCVINGKVYPQMTSDAVKIVLDTLLAKERG